MVYISEGFLSGGSQSHGPPPFGGRVFPFTVSLALHTEFVILPYYIPGGYDWEIKTIEIIQKSNKKGSSESDKSAKPKKTAKKSSSKKSSGKKSSGKKSLPKIPGAD